MIKLPSTPALSVFGGRYLARGHLGSAPKMPPHLSGSRGRSPSAARTDDALCVYSFLLYAACYTYIYASVCMFKYLNFQPPGANSCISYRHNPPQVTYHVFIVLIFAQWIMGIFCYHLIQLTVHCNSQVTGVSSQGEKTLGRTIQTG